MLLIARGLPFRETFALRPPASWSQAAQIALLAILAIWATSFVIELLVGHGSREQAIPQYWDPSRVGVFVASAIAIAIFAPLVEELMCRGLGFALLAPWGEGVAVVGTATAFTLAHGAVTDLPWVFVTGVGLGYLRARSGSLYPCVALHVAINGIAVLAAAYLGARGA